MQKEVGCVWMGYKQRPSSMIFSLALAIHLPVLISCVYGNCNTRCNVNVVFHLIIVQGDGGQVELSVVVSFIMSWRIY